MFVFLLKSWGDFDDKIIQWIHGEGTAVMDISFLLPYELEYGKWHRSKDNTGDNQFCSVMINKKWWLEEELNNHILQFQQVNIESLLLNN